MLARLFSAHTPRVDRNVSATQEIYDRYVSRDRVLAGREAELRAVESRQEAEHPLMLHRRGKVRGFHALEAAEARFGKGNVRTQDIEDELAR
jgi:hypothetical protein